MLPGSVSVNGQCQKRVQRRGTVGLYFVACLSVLAGMTDAIGFMATGDFVSFMSGNTTRLAVSLGNAELGPVIRLALVIGAFVAGNALGVIIAVKTGRRPWPLLTLIAALLAVAGLLPAPLQLPALLAAVTAMGMINAVVEEVNGLPIGLTYVTGALSRFGRGLGRTLLGQRRMGWRVQLVPWCGMFLGAIGGVLLEQQFGRSALLASALLTALLGLVSLKIPRRWQLRYMPR
ncbi:YoaK family protein [Pseudomonas guariconensis]|uniref:YoaK family protein n=1 Tax=Pseudomonas TaxID=286 RepID=UPI002096D7D1|nr:MULTISPECIES: YoaK family protein [Pseudomonas]MCO7640686.1 YoaK family protein [Pseudomonas sp. S 311-6]MCO7515776.1 YoaK family protein [Pseudomonas putida]MCO7566380.1 YoaK family protein [Pseudomonas mosselii]MCO7597410.1 YoaK family protein [Pseudomonas guariconensis]MCO7605632.1 YoaK family protein [Pseudomonas guariconensis]